MLEFLTTLAMTLRLRRFCKLETLLVVSTYGEDQYLARIEEAGFLTTAIAVYNHEGDAILRRCVLPTREISHLCIDSDTDRARTTFEARYGADFAHLPDLDGDEEEDLDDEDEEEDEGFAT